MSFEKLENDDEPLPFDYCGICPKCHIGMIFYHDLKCEVCDQKRIMYCPGCESHYRLKF